MRRDKVTEKLIQAMAEYDAVGGSWNDLLTKHHLCHSYKYIPADIRTHGSVYIMQYLSTIRYKNTKMFNFLITDICGIKLEHATSFFGICNETDEALVAELRKRGWDVTATKEVKQIKML